jgi:tocopherol O-methyltransferase
MEDYTATIIRYYETCAIDYRLVWHLDTCCAMHFGYWDEHVTRLRYALDRENAILAERAHIRHTDRVLDAGCGVGGSAIYLAKTIGCDVVGITLVPSQVRAAMANAQKHGLEGKAHFLPGDYCNTGLPSGSFDVVWAIESVCHAQSKKAFLQEAFRLLTPTGRLIIADGFASKTIYTSAEQLLMNAWLRGWAVEALESKEHFEQHIRGIGFKHVSYSNITQHVMPSSRRLYLYSFLGIFIGRMLELAHLRSKIQTADILATRFQHITLKRGLWQYGIFYAEK